MFARDSASRSWFTARAAAGVTATVATVAVAALAATGAAGSPPAAAQTAVTSPAASGYTGYGGTRWSTDYGIGAGRCDRDQIVVESSGAGQTLVQRHEENLKNRTVGIIGATGGTGLLLSTRTIGRGRLDERDRRCLGHVLELGSAGQRVGWTNSGTRRSYAVVVSEYSPSSAVPSGARSGSRDRCRVLVLTTVGAGASGRGITDRLIACEANPGVWSIR